MVERKNGRTLRKSNAVQESDDSSGEEADESSEEIEEIPKPVYKSGWDELQDDCHRQQQDSARILSEERERKSRKEKRRVERDKPEELEEEEEEKPEWEKLQEECHKQMMLNCARSSSEESTPSKKSVKSETPSIKIHLDEVFHEKSIDEARDEVHHEGALDAETHIDTETCQTDVSELSRSQSQSQDSGHEILDVIDEVVESFDQESKEIA